MQSNHDQVEPRDRGYGELIDALETVEHMIRERAIASAQVDHDYDDGHPAN